MLELIYETLNYYKVILFKLKELLFLVQFLLSTFMKHEITVKLFC